jgi:signal transduction histidine kinase
MDNESSIKLAVYTDKDGFPVIYDAAIREMDESVSQDDLSVLWHEILSPLTVIKGYTRTLLELNDVITEDQKKEYLQGIDSASNRMVRLLENLRDISCLENPDVWITHPVYLIDILKRIISEIQRQTIQHTIKIRPQGHLPLIRVEPEKIEQVITNLINNAIKYSPDGGEISVDITLVRDEQDLTQLFENAPPIKLPCLITSIADEGIGIPEYELENIFKRFYRVKDQIIKTTPGAGLGLYICQMLVEGHGGRIWANNRLNRGSVFSFSLPL